MLVLAKAACGSSQCHGVWVDPESGDLLVVGDRKSVTPARGDARAWAVVEVALPVYAKAANALRLAAECDRPGLASGDLLPAWVTVNGVCVAGEPRADAPPTIGVAPHEQLIVVRRVEAVVVRALAATGLR